MTTRLGWRAHRPRATLAEMVSNPAAFATDHHTAAYYDQRAREYDDWYTGQGVFAARRRPGWDENGEALLAGRLFVVARTRI